MVNTRQLIDQGLGLSRRTSRQALRLGGRLASDAAGAVERLRHARPAPKAGMDDQTLRRKVESVIFRDADAPKDTVDVTVVDRVVELRGQAKTPTQVNRLIAKAQAIPEVRGVENLLHLPKTPAPTRADAPARQQKTTRATKRTTATKRPQKVTDDKTSKAPGAEPTGKQRAAARKGREAAPLGSEDPNAG